MVFNALKSAMSSASQGMQAQSFRLRIASENLSNADTNGYRRKQVSFQNIMNAQAGTESLTIGNVTLDPRAGEQQYDPTHPLADAKGYVTLSNVDMMLELADAREASRSYEANLTTFNQARSMYSGLLDLLRR